MRNNARIVLLVLITLSVAMGVYEGFLYIKALEITEKLYFVWGIVSAILLALWVSEESKLHPSIYRPFEFGYLVFIFYIPYLPYYLVKTRGVAIGIAVLLGFLLLFNIGLLFQWLIYLVS